MHPEDKYIDALRGITGLAFETERAKYKAIVDQAAYISNARSILHQCLAHGYDDEDALWFSTSGIEFETFNYLYERADGNLLKVRKDIEWWLRNRDLNLKNIETAETSKLLENGRRIVLFCIENELPEKEVVLFSTSGIDANFFFSMYNDIVAKLYEAKSLTNEILIKELHLGVQRYLRENKERPE